MQVLCDACNGEYGLSCEHAHSCCILLARKSRFLIEGRWHTWIDYNKFQVIIHSVSATSISNDDRVQQLQGIQMPDRDNRLPHASHGISFASVLSSAAVSTSASQNGRVGCNAYMHWGCDLQGSLPLAV